MTKIDFGLDDLQALNRISETLNRAVDRESALQSALEALLAVMGLETGWIFLHEDTPMNAGGSAPFRLAASQNLPPAIETSGSEAWAGGCDCQELCLLGELNRAYTEVHCSRLAVSQGDRRGLTVHATAPVRLGEDIIGILNIAGENWDSFTPRALALLSSVGGMIGIALERAGHYDALRRRHLQEQIALLELSNQLLGRVELLEIGDLLVREACRLMHVDAAALLLLDESESVFEFLAATGWKDDPVLAGHLIPLEPDTGPGQVVASGQPLVVEDLESHDPTHWAPDWIRR